jgi:hypothetical protein
MTPTSLIGGHVSVAGGLATGGLKYMAEIGAEMIQVFVTNPRGWALTEGKPAEDAKLAESGVETFIHVPYLVNFGSPNTETLANSIAIVRHTLRRGVETGAKGIVVHTGSAVTQSREDALRQLHDNLLPLLEEIPEGGPDLLLEPMAGQGAMLCATVRGAGDVRRAARERARAAQADPRQRLQGRVRRQEGPPREHRGRAHRLPAVRRPHAAPGGRRRPDLHRDPRQGGEEPRGHRATEETPRHRLTGKAPSLYARRRGLPKRAPLGDRWEQEKRRPRTRAVAVSRNGRRAVIGGKRDKHPVRA